MSTRSDFNYIPVRREFNANNPEFQINFPIETAGQSVVDDGYLIITVRSVDLDSHRIRINNTDLTSFDIPLPPGNSDAFLTYMDRIQPGVLREGSNTLEIIRVGNDNFLVRDLVINWRERDTL